MYHAREIQPLRQRRPMVVKRRWWRRQSLTGLTVAFFIATSFIPLPRMRCDDRTPSSKIPATVALFNVKNLTSLPQSSTPTQTSNSRPTRRRVPPPKPVPLTPPKPVPIETGEGNPLGAFFKALEALESSTTESPRPQVVRIIHFGDSHVASDYWAGVVRQKLQARFGDGGPGFVLPGRPWSTIHYAQAQSLDGQYWRTDGLRPGEADGVVGLGGMSIESFREANPASALATYSQFQVFAAASPGSDCLSVQVDDADYHDLTSNAEAVIPAPSTPATQPSEPSGDSPGGGPREWTDLADLAEMADPPAPPVSTTQKRRRRKPAPLVPPWKPWPAGSPLDLLEIANSMPLVPGPHRISIRSSCASMARLLGVELFSGSKGIVYDTDGVNGAHLSDLEKPLPELRRALLQQAHPALIIVSYGTNDIGMSGFTASGYEEGAFQILSKLKADAGDVSILVTGPTDRGNARRLRRISLQAEQAELQPALRRAALRAGCAYWDQQAAMGGPSSMSRWVRAGLGRTDYVHFSAQGYAKLAGMLYDQLMSAYDNFRKSESPE